MMVDLGADYSWARPGGAALRAAGVTAVGRYLASDGRGITAGEYQDLKAHGLGVWLVREGAASGMLGGFGRGVADALISVAQIAAVGLPADSLVYAAADWDVSTSQFPTCDAYLRGFASVVGVNRTGIYGGLHYLNHVHAAGLAVGFWQAGATSWNHGEAPQMQISFEQTVKTPPLAGTDHNYVFNTTTLAGSGAAILIGDEIDMASIAELDKLITDRINAALARFASVDQRESRTRLYRNTGTGQLLGVNWSVDASAPNRILYLRSDDQAAHLDSMYQVIGDDPAQALPVAAENWDTLLGLANGSDPVYTAA